MKRFLERAVGIFFLAIAVVFTLTAFFGLVLPYSQSVVRSHLAPRSEQAVQSLDLFFRGWETQLAILRDFDDQNSILETESFQAFFDRVIPVLRHNPALSAVYVAGSDGREWIAFRESDGWHLRLDPGRRQPARWQYRNSDGDVTRQFSQTSTYDPRARPWFDSAVGKFGSPSWVGPYPFYTKKSAGITLSLASSENHTPVVWSFDIVLGNLTDLLTSVPGKSADDSFLSLLDSRGDSVSSPEDTIPIVIAGRDAWIQKGSPSLGDVVEFRTGGAPWLVSFQHFSRSGLELLVGSYEHNAFGSELWGPLILLLVLQGLVLWAAAMVFARFLTARAVGPLGTLAQKVQALGALDFATATKSESSAWPEIQVLETSFTQMAHRIAETNANLEALVAERTASLDLFRTVIEQSSLLVVITNTDGVIEYINPQFTQTYGYTADEVQGRKPSLLKSGRNPDSFYAELWGALNSGRTWRGEFVNAAKSGLLVWVDAVLAPVETASGEIRHYVSIGNDQRALRSAQKSLADQLTLLEYIIDTVPNPLFFKDAQGRFLGCNRAYEVAFGVNRNELIGRTLDEISSFVLDETQRRQIHREDLETIVHCRSVHSQIRRFLADGLEHELLHWTTGFRSGDDGPAGLVGLVVDISELKQTERDLIAARQAAESATQVKADFLSNMSHELRTPLNAIIGLSHLALGARPNGRQRDYLQKIHGAGNLLLSIVNDILDYSKLEAGKVVLEERLLSVDAVVSAALEMVLPQAQSKGLEVICRISDHFPSSLTGDSLRLTQVLTNLLSNAVKFTPRGEILLDVSAHLEEQSVLVNFRVSDTGIGMSSEQLSSLFQPFTQADGSTTRQFGGTGLGLSIVKRLVEQMRGEIAVESSPGHGSLFSIKVRLDLPSAPLPGAPQLPSRLVDTTALVVDDNADARDVLKEYLERFGCRVEACPSGPQALQWIDSGGRPSIAFVDWKMPEWDGLETAKRLKNHPDLNSLSVILVSAFVDDLDPSRWAGLIDDVLAKPVSPSRLLDVLVGNHSGPVLFGETEESLVPLSGRVLVAEDNAINTQILVELLESWSLKVVSVTDGLKAIEEVEKNGPFDLVLMDLQMPTLDGWEASRRLLASHRGLPIVAVTAHAIPEERERCLALGMVDHVAKPLVPPLLHQILTRWLPQGSSVGRGTTSDEFFLPDVDIAAGLARVGHRIEVYRRLLGEFVRGHGRDVLAARAAWSAGDESAARRIVHTLKGVASNLGVVKVQAAAEAWENTPGDWTDLEDSWASFEQSWLERADASIPASEDLEQEAPEPGDWDRLDSLLETQDSEALDLWPRLASGFDGPRALVDEALAQFDFARARAILRAKVNKGITP